MVATLNPARHAAEFPQAHAATYRIIVEMKRIT